MKFRQRLRKKLKRHIRGYRVVYQLLGIVGVSAAVIGLIFFAFGTQSTETRPSSSTAAAASDAPEEPTILPFERDHRGSMPARALNLNEIVERVFAAYGGRDAIRTLTSLRQEGRLEQEAAPALSVNFFWRAPDSVRYTIAAADGQFRRAYNGNVTWEAVVNDDQISDSRSLPPVEHERFIRDSRMSQPVTFSLLQFDRLSLEADRTIDGRRCYVVALERRSYREILYFDQVNFLCLRRERDDRDLEEGNRQVQVNYSDFRETGGLVFPFRQEVLFDGERYNQVITLQLTLNPGLLTTFFDPPAGHSR